MRTDGIFTVRESTIETRIGEPFQVIPFGDIHRDSPACAVERWREFLDRARRLKRAYFLGMGDYFDGYSTSERRIVYSKDLHESTAKREEETARARVRSLAKELAPIKGRFLGLMGGNHFQQYPNGTTSDNYLAELLGTRYLGACCALRLRIETGNHHLVFDIFAHHGRGGGRTAGGRFNSVEQLASVADADIYLMGDNHACGALPGGERLRIMHNPRGPYIRARKVWLGRTGSFLRGYVDGESSYVVDAAMPPANLGWIEFEITPKRDRANGGDDLRLEITARS